MTQSMPKSVKADTLNRITDYFKKSKDPFSSAAQIARTTGSHLYAVHRGLEILRDTGFVKEIKHKKGTYYIWEGKI